MPVNQYKLSVICDDLDHTLIISSGKDSSFFDIKYFQLPNGKEYLEIRPRSSDEVVYQVNENNLLFVNVLNSSKNGYICEPQVIKSHPFHFDFIKNKMMLRSQSRDYKLLKLIDDATERKRVLDSSITERQSIIDAEQSERYELYQSCIINRKLAEKKFSINKKIEFNSETFVQKISLFDNNLNINLNYIVSYLNGNQDIIVLKPSSETFMGNRLYARRFGFPVYLLDKEGNLAGCSYDKYNGRDLDILRVFASHQHNYDFTSLTKTLKESRNSERSLYSLSLESLSRATSVGSPITTGYLFKKPREGGSPEVFHCNTAHTPDSTTAFLANGSLTDSLLGANSRGTPSP